MGGVAMGGGRVVWEDDSGTNSSAVHACVSAPRPTLLPPPAACPDCPHDTACLFPAAAPAQQRAPSGAMAPARFFKHTWLAAAKPPLHGEKALTTQNYPISKRGARAFWHALHRASGPLRVLGYRLSAPPPTTPIYLSRHAAFIAQAYLVTARWFSRHSPMDYHTYRDITSTPTSQSSLVHPGSLATHGGDRL